MKLYKKVILAAAALEIPAFLAGVVLVNYEIVPKESQILVILKLFVFIGSYIAMFGAGLGWNEDNEDPAAEHP